VSRLNHAITLQRTEFVQKRLNEISQLCSASLANVSSNGSEAGPPIQKGGIMRGTEQGKIPVPRTVTEGL